MSGVALKITTLLIRTISKPIASRIKAQAREHEGFRRVCVGWAQLIHRVDMRLRLGLLQDPAVLERQAAREAAEHARAKRMAEAPTVKTEAEAKAEDEERRREIETGVKRKREERGRVRVKPLSEAKAIDLGSNFIAEGFLFAVAVGTVLFETWRSRRKEKGRRDEVREQLEELRERDEGKAARIEQLEAEIEELRAREWHWPWSRGYVPGDEERAIRSRILDQVAQRQREREREREQANVLDARELEPKQAGLESERKAPLMTRPAMRGDDNMSDPTAQSNSPKAEPMPTPTTPQPNSDSGVEKK